MSRLQLSIPADLYRTAGYPHVEALFGVPKYSGTIAERVFHGGVKTGGLINTWTLCTNREAEDLVPKLPSNSPFILMVDRGGCTFVSKVRRAQHLGATGVIIADNTCLCSDEERGTCRRHQAAVPCQQVEPVMEDDGSGHDVIIPSFLMKREDAGLVKARLQNGLDVQAEMTWRLPAPKDTLEWSLWTSATDTSAAPFKRDFKEVVKALGKQARFTPHYVVYNGADYGCTGQQRGGANCGSLCTNRGRYCMTDPDFNSRTGVSGADVVKEALRQKCVWNLYGGQDAPLRDQGIGEMWWSYVNEFSSACPASGDRFKDEGCVARAMEETGVDKNFVDKCMSDSGGTDGDVPNTILEQEMAEKRKESIVIVPTVFVNDVRERGGISKTSVLRSICAGLEGGTAPEVCRCVNTTDLMYACMNNTDDQSPGGGGGLLAGSALFLLGVLVGAMVAAGFVRYKHTRAEMQDQGRGVLDEYMALDDDAATNAPGSSAREPLDT